MQFLLGLGASSVCLPPELPMSAVDALAHTSQSLGVGCEVWSFGRIPLAISARCYHARVTGRTKDSCKFICTQDQDGLDIKTMDGQHFLCVNGVQTLSHDYCCTIDKIGRLSAAGVTSLRLSPQSCDMILVSTIFRESLDGHIDPEEGWRQMQSVCGPVRFTDGFLSGGPVTEINPNRPL